jgi:predicted acylesterase/phospholipase RssA
VALAASGRSNHLVSDRGLRQLLARHLPYELLQDAAVPVVVVATEIATGREVVLQHGPAAEAVLASASLPGVLPPVTIDGHALIDGGLVDNTPISAAAALDVDSIIVVPTGYACALPTVPQGALAMALHAVTLSIQRRLIDDVARLQPTLDLRVVPPCARCQCRPSTSAKRASSSTGLTGRQRSGSSGPGARTRQPTSASTSTPRCPDLTPTDSRPPHTTQSATHQRTPLPCPNRPHLRTYPRGSREQLRQRRPCSAIRTFGA